jgi:hypothetical protein
VVVQPGEFKDVDFAPVMQVGFLGKKMSARYRSSMIHEVSPTFLIENLGLSSITEIQELISADGSIFGEYFFNCKLYKANFLIREIDNRADVTFCIDLARLVTETAELQVSLSENSEVHPILMLKEKSRKDRS